MADDRDDQTPQEPTAGEEPAADREAAEAADAQEPVSETLAGSEEPEEPAAEQEATPEPVAEGEAEEATAEPVAEGEGAADETEEFDEDEGEPTPRVKPEIPGADLEVDIVEEGVDPLLRGEEDDEEATPGESEEIADEPIAAVTIDLAAGARYRATGKRKTAIARVTLVPGTGAYTINGRELDIFFPRATLQRNIRQPLEAVGYDTRMDVIARMHGGGVSAQAGALRHGISRALLEADPNLRGELKRRGFLTRDPRVKERKKAGLKKARKRPQFSKR